MSLHLTQRAMAAAIVLCAAGPALAQAPSAVGVQTAQMDAIATGWSVDKDLHHKNVYNDRNDKIGTISDIIVTPSASAGAPVASYAIIGVGGFVGLGRHDVAIPMEQLQAQKGKWMLPGATKETLKALPAYQYKHK